MPTDDLPDEVYRQIIETESVNNLDLEEQQLVSEDQKHSSNVARVHYQKLRSREVALKGRSCMEELCEDHGRAGKPKAMVRRRHLIQAKGEIENNDETQRKSRVKVRFTQ